MLRLFYRFSALSILSAFFLLLAGPSVVAQVTSVAPEEHVVSELPSANDLSELTRILGDQRIQKWLADQAEIAEADTVDAAILSSRAQFQLAIDRVRERTSELMQAWEVLPQTPQTISEVWQSELSNEAKLRSLTYLVIFLVVGAGLEWLYRQYTAGFLLQLELKVHTDLRSRIKGALTRSTLIFVGLLVFGLGSIGTFASFSWQPLIETLVSNLLILVLLVRVASALSLFFLAPYASELRLFPLSNKLAKFFHFWILLLTTAAAVTLMVPDIMERFLGVAIEGGNRPVEIISVQIALEILFFALGAFFLWMAFRTVPIKRTRAAYRSARLWRTYMFCVLGLACALSIVGLYLLTASVFILGFLFPLLRGLSIMNDHLFAQGKEAYLAKARLIRDQEKAAALELMEETEENAQEGELTEGEVAEPEEDDVLMKDPYALYRPVVLRAVRILAVALAAFLTAEIWDANVFQLSASNTFTGIIASVLLDSVVALLVADLVWVWAKTAIDARLADYKPPEGGEAPGPEARMATLLPLLRMTLLITLLIVVFLSVLSSLGVNIAPLIAGAGVLGIAIGFGTQSLVRDIISGVFFLIDDAFRLGEYIEIGELRGAVESISLRSLRVRHHRGMIHTIPFGELKHLTNYSRDWVIMKLEFRVPFETDLKLVKKLIKKVGAQLLENEFYGDSILQTLKSQGVRRMEEFNMVVGVKFMTKPGEQWLVRRDAYQGVRDAFEANGIRLAERNVKVEIQGGDHLNEETKKAVAAAAQEAAQGPVGPPGTIPDEP